MPNLTLALIPAPPVPEFRTAAVKGGIAYGWRCEAEGILAYGDSKREAQANWVESYKGELGL